jgi:hypothetical protein
MSRRTRTILYEDQQTEATELDRSTRRTCSGCTVSISWVDGPRLRRRVPFRLIGVLHTPRVERWLVGRDATLMLSAEVRQASTTPAPSNQSAPEKQGLRDTWGELARLHGNDSASFARPEGRWPRVAS